MAAIVLHASALCGGKPETVQFGTLIWPAPRTFSNLQTGSGARHIKIAGINPRAVTLGIESVAGEFVAVEFSNDLLGWYFFALLRSSTNNPEFSPYEIPYGQKFYRAIAVRSIADALVPQNLSLVECVTKRLANELKKPSSEISLQHFEQVIWPDSCLGWHIPDYGCTLAVVPGYRMFFSTAETIVEVHTSWDGHSILFCCGKGLLITRLPGCEE